MAERKAEHTPAEKWFAELWGSAEYDCGPEDYEWMVEQSIAAMRRLKALPEPTPGTWSLKRRVNSRGDFLGYAIHGGMGTVIGEIYSVKDARLIAQSPDLLKAAKCFVRWVDACWGASEILSSETLKEYEEAKEAIRKAEGGE